MEKQELSAALKMMGARPAPVDLVHADDPDGCYFCHGEGNHDGMVQIVVVGPARTAQQYADLLTNIVNAEWVVHEEAELPPKTEKIREVVVRRGFMSIILKPAAG